METRATLSSYRQSPRKVRLVADMMRGKTAASALASLSMLVKRAAEPMEKLVKSAIANGKGAGANIENMFIAYVTVDKGPVMKRTRPRAFGRGARINKRTSHITIVLSDVDPKVPKVKNSKVKVQS